MLLKTKAFIFFFFQYIFTEKNVFKERSGYTLPMPDMVAAKEDKHGL